MRRMRPRAVSVLGAALWLAIQAGARPARETGAYDGAHGARGTACDIVHAHVRRYPLMQAADLYKLAHQAAFGPGHAVDDPEQARAWLLDEIDRLGAQGPAGGPGEPLMDPLLLDRSVVRVHLRPYLTAGLDPDELAAAFARSAAEHEAAPGVFERYRRCFERLAERGELAVEGAALAAYMDRRVAEGLPAVHHSDEYVRAYRPAYRVVLLERLPLDR